MESILNPVRGIRDAQARAGITPTNHSRHNILAIKEQSRLNALQKLQQQEDAQAAQQQRLQPTLGRSASVPGGAPAAGGRVVSRTQSVGAARQQSRTSSTDGGRNFILENRAAAAAASRPIKAVGTAADGSAFLQKSNYGQVPSYLLERKMQLAQEQEALQAAKLAAQIPAGAVVFFPVRAVRQMHKSLFWCTLGITTITAPQSSLQTPNCRSSWAHM